MGVRDRGTRWQWWLAAGAALVGVVCGPFALCGFVSAVVDVWGIYEGHPEWRDRLGSLVEWGRDHWWLAPLLIVVGLVTVLTAWWRRDWVRWGARGGLRSWVRWQRLDKDLRSRLEGLTVGARMLVIATVRVGELWPDGRLLVRLDDSLKLINSRRSWRPRWYSHYRLTSSLVELQKADVLTPGYVRSEDTYLVSFCPEFVRLYGSREQLAELLEVRLVLMREWKP